MSTGGSGLHGRGNWAGGCSQDEQAAGCRKDAAAAAAGEGAECARILCLCRPPLALLLPWPLPLAGRGWLAGCAGRKILSGLHQKQLCKDVGARRITARSRPNLPGPRPPAKGAAPHLHAPAEDGREVGQARGRGCCKASETAKQPVPVALRRNRRWPRSCTGLCSSPCHPRRRRALLTGSRGAPTHHSLRGGVREGGGGGSEAGPRAGQGALPCARAVVLGRREGRRARGAYASAAAVGRRPARPPRRSPEFIGLEQVAAVVVVVLGRALVPRQPV